MSGPSTTGAAHPARRHALYAANDPAPLAWVHVTEATSFLDAWIRYADPAMSPAGRYRYFTGMACIAAALGADPIPRTRREACAPIEATRPTSSATPAPAKSPASS